jgi:hypothetical protein
MYSVKSGMTEFVPVCAGTYKTKVYWCMPVNTSMYQYVHTRKMYQYLHTRKYVNCA